MDSGCLNEEPQELLTTDFGQVQRFEGEWEEYCQNRAVSGKGAKMSKMDDPDPDRRKG